MSRTARTPRRAREAFLEALRQGLSVKAACEAANMGRRTAYDLRESDLDFKAAWDAAIEEGTDLLEDEARRRAFEGIDQPLVSAGKLVATARRYSDPLLVFLLKSRRPEKYRERSTVEHSGTIDVSGARETLERKLAGLAAAGAAPGLPGKPE